MTEIQALLLIKSILESADIHGIEHILSEDCEYMSTGRGIWLSLLKLIMCLLRARSCILPMCTRRMRYSVRAVMV